MKYFVLVFQIDFEEPQTLSEIGFMFQGGFAGKTCWVEVLREGSSFEKRQDFYPEDSNKFQVFPLNPVSCNSVKIVFADSTDFYGRITVYQLRLK